MKKSKVKSIFKYLFLALFLLESLLLIVEALLPGSESSKNSNAVGGIIDDVLTDISDDTIREVKPEAISLPHSEITLACGEIEPLEVRFSPADTSVDYRRVLWSSDNESAVGVQNGVLIARAIGSATVTARLASDDSISAAVSVTVREVVAAQMSLKFSDGTVSKELSVGETALLEVKLEPEKVTDPIILFSCTDPAIATVDEDGVVKGVGPGKTQISANYIAHTSQDGVPVTLRKSVSVTVVDASAPVVPIEEIEPDLSFLEGDQSAPYLYAGDSGKMNAEILPQSATQKQIVWESSDPSVLSVTAAGEYKALKKGTVTVSVRAAANDKITKRFGVEIRNRALNAVLKLEGTDLGTGEGGYTARISAGAKNIRFNISADVERPFVKYSSSDDTIAEIYEDGTLSTKKSSKGTKDGYVTITVWVSDNADFAQGDGDVTEQFTVLLTVQKQAFSEGVSGWGLLIRKLFGHFGAFLVLGVLAATTAILFDRKSWKVRLVLLAALIVFGFTFACLTEILQTSLFTAGRGASFDDVIIDCNGYLPAALIVYGIFLVVSLIVWLVKRRKKSPPKEQQ